MHHYFNIQNIFTETVQQIDLSVNLCKVFFNAIFTLKHESFQTLNCNIYSTISNCKIQFLNSQLNNVIFMLQHTLKNIFTTFVLSQNSKIIEAVSKFKLICIYKNFVVNTISFNKTFINLLFFNYYTMYYLHLISNKNQCHQFILCIVFSEVVLMQ